MSSADKLHLVTKVDGLARASLLQPDPQLERAVTNSARHGLPPIAVHPLQGAYLALQCRLVGAKSVLEIGTLGGYSTTWLARSGARVTSIEIDPKRRAVAQENTTGLDVEILLGAALDVLPKLAAEGRVFDFVFVDASWDEQYEYFDWAVKLTRPGGGVYVDNVVREVLDEMDKGKEQEGLIVRVGKDKRVEATVVTTVSAHKTADDMMDGFLLAVVKGG